MQGGKGPVYPVEISTLPVFAVEQGGIKEKILRHFWEGTAEAGTLNSAPLRVIRAWRPLIHSGGRRARRLPESFDRGGISRRRLRPGDHFLLPRSGGGRGREHGQGGVARGGGEHAALRSSARAADRDGAAPPVAGLFADRVGSPAGRARCGSDSGFAPRRRLGLGRAALEAGRAARSRCGVLHR